MRGGTRFYYRADVLGSIVAHEEHSTGFAQRFKYGPFGESATATGHPFRYTARRIDDETGLYHYVVALKLSLWEGTLSEVVIGTIPFHLIMFVLLVLLMLWPDLALWLPRNM